MVNYIVVLFDFTCTICLFQTASRDVSRVVR